MNDTSGAIETAIMEILEKMAGEPVDHYYLVESLIDDMKEKGYRRSATLSAIDELVLKDKIIKRCDPHAGLELVASQELQQPLDDDYCDLKERTLTLARARGYTPKWREGRGWWLEDANDRIAFAGSIPRIAEFLEAE